MSERNTSSLPLPLRKYGKAYSKSRTYENALELVTAAIEKNLSGRLLFNWLKERPPLNTVTAQSDHNISEEAAKPNREQIAPENQDGERRLSQVEHALNEFCKWWLCKPKYLIEEQGSIIEGPDPPGHELSAKVQEIAELFRSVTEPMVRTGDARYFEAANMMADSFAEMFGERNPIPVISEHMRLLYGRGARKDNHRILSPEFEPVMLLLLLWAFYPDATDYEALKQKLEHDVNEEIGSQRRSLQGLLCSVLLPACRPSKECHARLIQTALTYPQAIFEVVVRNWCVALLNSDDPPKEWDGIVAALLRLTPIFHDYPAVGSDISYPGFWIESKEGDYVLRGKSAHLPADLVPNFASLMQLRYLECEDPTLSSEALADWADAYQQFCVDNTGSPLSAEDVGLIWNTLQLTGGQCDELALQWVFGMARDQDRSDFMNECLLGTRHYQSPRDITVRQQLFLSLLRSLRKSGLLRFEAALLAFFLVSQALLCLIRSSGMPGVRPICWRDLRKAIKRNLNGPNERMLNRALEITVAIAEEEGDNLYAMLVDEFVCHEGNEGPPATLSVLPIREDTNQLETIVGPSFGNLLPDTRSALAEALHKHRILARDIVLKVKDCGDLLLTFTKPIELELKWRLEKLGQPYTEWARKKNKRNRYSPRVMCEFMLQLKEETAPPAVKELLGKLPEQQDLLQYFKDELFTERNVGTHSHSLNANRYFAILERLITPNGKLSEFASVIPPVEQA